MKIVTGRLQGLPVIALWNDTNVNITRVGADLAFAAGKGIRNIDAACAGLCQKHLFGKKCSLNVACTAFEEQFSPIAAIKQDISRGSHD